MSTVEFTPIGTIHSPWKEPKGTPIQPVAAKDIEGTVEVLPEYADGLKDLDGFSHIILLYHFHLSKGYKLHAKPFLEDTPHGVFAMRAPKRPNPIGLSVVRLESVDGATLHIADIDIVDGTPLLDIKPYVPDFDHRDGIRIGWLKNRSQKASETKADSRFTNE